MNNDEATRKRIEEWIADWEGGGFDVAPIVVRAIMRTFVATVRAALAVIDRAHRMIGSASFGSCSCGMTWSGGLVPLGFTCTFKEFDEAALARAIGVIE